MELRYTNPAMTDMFGFFYTFFQFIRPLTLTFSYNKWMNIIKVFAEVLGSILHVPYEDTSCFWNKFFTYEDMGGGHFWNKLRHHGEYCQASM